MMTSPGPGSKAALEMCDIGVAQLLQGFHGERGSGAASAVQDRATVRIELGPMVLACRIGVELAHPSRGVYRTSDCPGAEFAAKAALVRITTPTRFHASVRYSSQRPRCSSRCCLRLHPKESKDWIARICALTPN
jgi:hypothetical protein